MLNPRGYEREARRAGLSILPTGFFGSAGTMLIATGILILVRLPRHSGQQLVGRHGRIRVGDHVGHRYLAVYLVRCADHGRFQDCVVPGQDRLDLLGVDVLAAPDDHVLDPVDDRQVAIRVQHADVAGVQPARPRSPRQWLRDGSGTRASRSRRG